jgi:DNA-binding transcriptional regulator YbjK
VSRRTEIADAAIATLAAQGMRGLTHRAVDREARLPEGSTSYYWRTRQALLQAVVERALELDVAYVSAFRSEGVDELVDRTARVTHEMLTAGRVHLLARYELYLESTRRPELAELMVAAADRIRGIVSELLDRVGVADPERRAAEFVAFLDGFVFYQVSGVGAGAGPIDIGEIRAALRALVTATIRDADAD